LLGPPQVGQPSGEFDQHRGEAAPPGLLPGAPLICLDEALREQYRELTEHRGARRYGFQQLLCQRSGSESSQYGDCPAVTGG